jgi:gamma-glutamyltranspeptidase
MLCYSGGFMLVHTKTEDKIINFRERAPAAATEKMFVNNSTLAQTVSTNN